MNSCRNCGSKLGSHRPNHLICPECRLLHFADGNPFGWAVIVDGVPGGVVEHKYFEPFTRDGEPLQAADISSILRVAAQIALEDPGGIKRVLDDETLEEVVIAQAEHGRFGEEAEA